MLGKRQRLFLRALKERGGEAPLYDYDFVNAVYSGYNNYTVPSMLRIASSLEKRGIVALEFRNRRRYVVLLKR